MRQNSRDRSFPWKDEQKFLSHGFSLIRSLPKISWTRCDPEHPVVPCVFLPIRNLRFVHWVLSTTEARPISCIGALNMVWKWMTEGETKGDDHCSMDGWLYSVIKVVAQLCGLMMTVLWNLTVDIYLGAGWPVIFCTKMIHDVINTQALGSLAL